MEFKSLGFERVKLKGIFETRYVSQYKINSIILNNFFNQEVEQPHKFSFNLMLITTDLKVVLLKRTSSFYYSKVVRDLKSNKINFALLESLYASELNKIKKIFFDFMDDISIDENNKTKKVYIFPGGHSIKNETIILTLLRELHEELNIHINSKSLEFNQTNIFNVLIYDIMVKKFFNNFIFPVKVQMSSDVIKNNFKKTKHTSDPIFIDISHCTTLTEAFILVQKFMIL